MSMNDVMKKKAIEATSAKRSNKVVKRIPRADIVELNRSMEPIIEQNRREYIEGSDAIGKDGHIYGDTYMERLREIAKPLFVTNNDSTPLRQISYKAKVECNNMIEPKIAQNRLERQKSLIKANDYIVR